MKRLQAEETTAANGGRYPALNRTRSGWSDWQVDSMGLLVVGASILSAGVAVVVNFNLALMILTIVGFVVAILGARMPFAGVMGISVLVVTDSLARELIMTGGILRFNTLNYFLIVLALLNLPTMFRNRSFILVSVILFVVQMGLWVFVSPMPFEDAIQNVINCTTFFGLAAVFMKTMANQRVRVWVGVIGLITGAAWGLAFVLMEGSLPDVNHNVWAYVPLTGLFLGTAALLTSKLKTRDEISLMVLLAACVVTVFLSGSRGTLFVAGTSLVFLGYSMRRRALPLLWVLIVCAGAFWLASGTRMGADSLARIEKFLSEDENVTSRSSGRIDLIEGGVFLFTQNPLGVGTGNFRYAWKAMGNREGMPAYAAGVRRTAHAAWLMVLVENGILGIILFFVWVLSYAIIGIARRRTGVTIIGAWVTCTLLIAFLFTEFASKGVWVLAAFGAVWLTFHREPRSRSGSFNRGLVTDSAEPRLPTEISTRSGA